MRILRSKVCFQFWGLPLFSLFFFLNTYHTYFKRQNYIKNAAQIYLSPSLPLYPISGPISLLLVSDFILWQFFFFAKINIYIQSYICIYTLLSLSYCMKYSTHVNCVLYLVFLSLNDISWSCSQSAYRNLFIFLTIAQYSIVTMYNSFHNHFPTVGDLGCFHSFIITDNATANNPGHMSYL